MTSSQVRGSGLLVTTAALLVASCGSKGEDREAAELCARLDELARAGGPEVERVHQAMVQTGCVESEASDTASIIDEIAIARVTERGATRGDDRFSEAAMEDRKKEGYF